MKDNDNDLVFNFKKEIYENIDFFKKSILICVLLGMTITTTFAYNVFTDEWCSMDVIDGRTGSAPEPMWVDLDRFRPLNGSSEPAYWDYERDGNRVSLIFLTPGTYVIHIAGSDTNIEELEIEVDRLPDEQTPCLNMFRTIFLGKAEPWALNDQDRFLGGVLISGLLFPWIPAMVAKKPEETEVLNG